MKLNKSFPSTFFLLAAFLLTAGNLPALAQNTESQLRRLEGDYFTDSGGPMAQELADKAEKELRTRPEFKPLLLNQLQREYFDAKIIPGRAPETHALSVIALRNDLTPAEQKIITDELEQLAGDPENTVFVNGAITLLKHYPSPEHEELILRFLKEPRWADPTVRVSFHSLRNIGTAKSLAVMREVYARMKARSAEDWLLELLQQDLQNLERRLEREAAHPRPPTGPQSDQQQKIHVPTVINASALSETSLSSTRDWLLWLGVLGGLALVIALACRIF